MGKAISPTAVTLELVDEVLGALNACQTIEQVDATARRYGHTVAAIAESPAFYERAIHIRNLAEYKRRRIRKGAARD